LSKHMGKRVLFTWQRWAVEGASSQGQRCPGGNK